MNSYLIAILLSVDLAMGDVLSKKLEEWVGLFKSEPVTFHREINSEHQFEIKACSLTYNGQELKFGQHIEEWINVLGPYGTRSIGGGPYVWQDMGIRVYTRNKKGKVTSIWFIYRRQPGNFSREIEIKTQRAMGGEAKVREYLEFERTFYPKVYFKDSILVDGVLMDDQFYLNRNRMPEELNQSRIEKGVNPFHKSMWKWNWIVLKNCDNKEYAVSVEVDKKNPNRLVAIKFRENSHSD